MTEQEMNLDVYQAGVYFSGSGVSVDRCRHESISETTLWFFHGLEIAGPLKGHRRQIGSASRLRVEPGTPRYWITTRMARGEPVARTVWPTLLEVVNDMIRYST